MKYKCEGNKCVEDPTGTYTKSGCAVNCPKLITLNNYKLNGTQYKDFKGTNAFQQAKDDCLNDLNTCIGINSVPNQASIVKTKDGQKNSFDVIQGEFATVVASSDGKNISPFTTGSKLIGTESKPQKIKTKEVETTLLKDKDAQGVNLQFIDFTYSNITLVKDIIGIQPSTTTFFSVKWG